VLTIRYELEVDVLALELYELEVTDPRDDFELEVRRAVTAARSGEVGDVGRARALYRRFGIDPTRVRPSSEALLRRLKKGEPLPRVNSLVDVANAMSVQLQVPVGLYDLDKTKGDELVVRLGAEGESYTGIRKERVNVAGTLNLLELCRQFGVNKFIFGSSSSVYGATSRAPFSEDQAELRPISPYAAAKLAGEMLGYTYAHLFGLPVICLRFFTVYGPRQRPDLAIHKFARRMLGGEKLPFFGDGSTRRDYTYIDDILAGVLASLSVPLSRHEVVNLGGAQTTSLRELIALLEDALGVRAGLDLQPAQMGDMPLTSADVTHAGRVLGYAPRTPLRDGIRLFAEWIRGEGRDWV